mmetsp:Transcript_24282/g.77017  ORF Transcript_24282/g.77017 Transcript_24282/m.77017 type:complete len:299 (-) Transcript_24282:993-1889(-)
MSSCTPSTVAWTSSDRSGSSRSGRSSSSDNGCSSNSGSGSIRGTSSSSRSSSLSSTIAWSQTSLSHRTAMLLRCSRSVPTRANCSRITRYQSMARSWASRTKISSHRGGEKCHGRGRMHRRGRLRSAGGAMEPSRAAPVRQRITRRIPMGSRGIPRQGSMASLQLASSRAAPVRQRITRRIPMGSRGIPRQGSMASLQLASQDAALRSSSARCAERISRLPQAASRSSCAFSMVWQNPAVQGVAEPLCWRRLRRQRPLRRRRRLTAVPIPALGGATPTRGWKGQGCGAPATPRRRQRR